MSQSTIGKMLATAGIAIEGQVCAKPDASPPRKDRAKLGLKIGKKQKDNCPPEDSVSGKTPKVVLESELAVAKTRLAQQENALRMKEEELRRKAALLEDQLEDAKAAEEAADRRADELAAKMEELERIGFVVDEERKRERAPAKVFNAGMVKQLVLVKDARIAELERALGGERKKVAVLEEELGLGVSANGMPVPESMHVY
ncbi:hypothetical protein [Poseidonocella sp. HB161398]|uniref:hypothetical protein n=1 Tax=Poseidonocella sp. HB161398 TaxID=2320855 RepID=UPI001108CD89|nr:hypothetical protein [Poseidonocella sp. HB161398]